MDDKESLLREMREIGDQPPSTNSRVQILKRLLETNPPRYQKFPGLVVVTFLTMILGFASMGAGLIGFGYVYFYSGNTGIYYWPHSQESEAPGFSPQPLDVFQRSIWLAISVGAFIGGFMMVAYSEAIKLFMDLQENADRQSIALHAIFHVLLEERK